MRPVRRFTTRLAALVLLGLAGCRLTGGPPAQLTIIGRLQLPQGIATAGEVVVELRDSTDGRVLTEQRQPLQGDPAVLPFLVCS